MLRLDLELSENSYPIFIGENALQKQELFEPFVANKKVMLVSDSNVAPFYLNEILRTLTKVANKIIPVVIPCGEKSKNWQNAENIITELLKNNFNRDSVIVSLGGGMVSDLAGFVAGIYQRGIAVIHIPTSLLAQVDAAIGGKTAINHTLGKNMIGVFHQPKMIVIDSKTLKTLDKRELSAGLAEVIKYGLIMSEQFTAWLKNNLTNILALDQKTVTECIFQCCKFKAQVVTQDSTEQNIRAILNFGHTFGHSIEALLGFKDWLHGEAVAVGMLQACALSQSLGFLQKEDLQDVYDLISQAKLPTKAPKGLNAEDYLKIMQKDKKVLSDKLRFIILEKIGKAKITNDVSQDQIINAINKFS